MVDCTVLLVDDEPQVAKSIRRALRNEGYRILIAPGGEAALSVLASEPVEVIISDYQMPGMTGSELLTRVRQQYPDVVRLMLTGEADLQGVVQAINEGNIYKFLTKPWCNDNLREVVRDAAQLAAERHESSPSSSPERFDQALAAHAAVQAGVAVLEIRNPAARNLMQEDELAECLQQMSSRCQGVIGPMLLPVSMLESSVFAVAFDLHLDPAQMTVLARELSKPYALPSQLVSLRVAVGFAQQDASGSISSSELLRRALTASVEAEAGEAVQFSKRLQVNLFERHSLESDMRGGLKRGEFFLQYQPLVDSKTRHIRGVEALCRWRHPERGFISPLQFIDLAERNGFINELGLWVVEHSCGLLRQLITHGHDDISVSFNVSPRQFATTGWRHAIADFVQRHRIPARLLKVEITESTIMADPELAATVLEELRACGVSLAMDDFGTGHSSLALLNQLPIDVLKLDRALVESIESDKRALTLFGRLLSLARDLGMTTVVEGVETEGQAEYCRDFGCDLAQGYLFHKPMNLGHLLEELNREQGLQRQAGD